ncbi:hypothetical protein M514_13625 [Trichuris suis]|uniref:Mos1 transposase HTH domain-containing protein n=1 Tax=Trichuris suis TaxID=68888 RepID=A0A085MSN6_9BILA|nr:hypothetical protein M513_13625 [Trichuris suis]KFD60232.1 hypothetical protein M514_13625 [Trichuris suis]
MEPDNIHVRHCLLFLFNQEKTAAEAARILRATYGDGVATAGMCRKWYKRFRSGDFHLYDKPRSGRPRKIENEDIEEFLSHYTSVTTREIAEGLHITGATVARRLRAMGITQKPAEWVSRE